MHWGWELFLNWNDKIGDNFRYWATFNLSYNQNEILEDKKKRHIETYLKEEGQTADLIRKAE